MPNGEQAERAFNIGLAAIIGDRVYNFGELLAHEILGSLQNTNNAWLVELLYAFNSGNIDRFNALKDKWSAQVSVCNGDFHLYDLASAAAIITI